MAEEFLRIGELSRRVGVSAELLRAWERRYGLLEPVRTQGGFRLYNDEDVARVLTMRANLERGLSAAEAARAALAGARESATPVLVEGTDELARALERLDESAAQGALDHLLAGLSLEVVLGDVLIPYLHELGSKWERGEVSVGQEHFASNVIRGRLLGLARGWDRGVGPRALLACAAGEQHDLPLLVFGLALRMHGWRISYLGSDTPVASIVDATTVLAPSAVVVSGTLEGVFEPIVEDLRKVARLSRLYLGGAASSESVARSARACYLDGDLVAAAALVATDHS